MDRLDVPRVLVHLDDRAFRHHKHAKIERLELVQGARWEKKWNNIVLTTHCVEPFSTLSPGVVEEGQSWTIIQPTVSSMQQRWRESVLAPIIKHIPVDE
jgi:hypothetical protein